MDLTTSKQAAESVVNASLQKVSASSDALTQAAHAITFNTTDYIILGIIICSVAISFWRGFLKEALSLAVWIIAIWVAVRFSHDLAEYFTHQLKNPTARVYLSAGILFIATLLLGALINYVINRLFNKSGLNGGLNRFFGFFFGLLRGLLVVAIVIFCLGFTNFTDSTWWKDSFLIPHFVKNTKRVQDFLIKETEPADSSNK